MSELAAWDSFYVIVGSAAGALIGLQFVVVTLMHKGRRAPRRKPALLSARRPSFISARLCCCRRWSASHGKRS
jgi:hypothetical protein